MIDKTTELDAKFNAQMSCIQSMWRSGAVEAVQYFGVIERVEECLTFDPIQSARVIG